MTKCLVHFIIKSNCIHVPCHPQAALRHLPPQLLHGVTALFPVTGHSCWALTASGGAAIPCSVILSPHCGCFGAQVPRNALLRECVVSFSSVGCKHSSQSLLQGAAVPRIVCGWSQTAPIPELNCTDMLVLTHTPP